MVYHNHIDYIVIDFLLDVNNTDDTYDCFVPQRLKDALALPITTDL